MIHLVHCVVTFLKLPNEMVMVMMMMMMMMSLSTLAG